MMARPLSETNIKLVLASGNQGKLLEMEQLLQPLSFQVISMKVLNVPEPEETGLSFIENAILKARHAAKYTDQPALADDSGIEVDALNGAPGIYSARFAGKGATDADNNNKLLKELANVPEEQRSARYHCVLALVQHANDPTPVICQGHWEGKIALSERGNGGFGYDPLFYVPTHNCHAAELSANEKNHISHRAQALQALLKHLQE